jgi:hypothetical protein
MFKQVFAMSNTYDYGFPFPYGPAQEGRYLTKHFDL